MANSSYLFPKLHAPVATGKNDTKIYVWNKRLPVKYLNNSAVVVSKNKYFLFLRSRNNFFKINKNYYGSLVYLACAVNKKGMPFISEIGIPQTKLKLKKLFYEDELTKSYSLIFLNYLKTTSAGRSYLKTPSPININIGNIKEKFSDKKAYIKHLTRLRYRWFFKPRLAKFKLFKKFFKRTLKRFRKISKNKLFVDKFRSHFSRITGFKEKSLFKLWLPFRKNYNQYWSTTNAVQRFSQSLVLTPPSFLIFLRLSPSLAASKYLVKSGALAINGLAVTNFTTIKPGDIMQINLSAWKAARSFFSYQPWHENIHSSQCIPFLHVDWSSMIFFMVRWPHKYELVAPSFLSERWVRYYIRLFPVKAAKFKKARNNLKIYKKIKVKK